MLILAAPKEGRTSDSLRQIAAGISLYGEGPWGGTQKGERKERLRLRCKQPWGLWARRTECSTLIRGLEQRNTQGYTVIKHNR